MDKNHYERFTEIKGCVIRAEAKSNEAANFLNNATKTNYDIYDKIKNITKSIEE